MAKELPYWKFVVQEYIAGNISLERWELQGIFYNLCAFYWSRECNVSIPTLKKKYDKESDQDLITELYKLDIIKLDEGYLSISFLNEQWSSKETQKMVNAINGKKGGRPKKESQSLPKDNQTETDSVFLGQNDPEKKPNGLFFDNPNITNIEYSKVEYSKEEESKVKFASPSVEILGNDELIADKVSVINDVLKYFEMDAQTFHRERSAMFTFVNLLHHSGDYDHFKIQWDNYKLFKDKTGNKHTLFGFIGFPDKKFENSKWNSSNWESKLNELNAVRIMPNTPAKQTIQDKIEIANALVNQFDPNAPAPH